MPLESFLIFAWYLLALAGVSLATGKLASWILARDSSCQMPLGLAVFPTIVAYGGFLHVWKIPYLSTLIAAAASAYGVRAMYDFWRRTKWKEVGRRWWVFAVPALMLAVLIYAKSSYLIARISAGDEGRSVMFISAFASNDLKPAYPFDFSLPVAYPYNLFETGAFLYHAARGFLYPTIPLFATALTAVAMFFCVLHLISRLVFDESADWKFALTAFILIFSGLYGLKESLGFLPLVRSPLKPASEFFHSGYHYLYGAALGVWGMALIAKHFRENDKNAWYLAVLILCLSFGFAGLTSAWAGLGAIVLVLHNLFIERHKLFKLLRLMPVTLLIAILVLLPHAFSFLPRFDSAFSFSLPHIWFPGNAQILAVSVRPAFAFLSLFFLGPMSLFFTAGPFIFGAFFFALLAVTRLFARKEKNNRLLAIHIGIVSSFLLLTFTTTLKTDWYSRGFLMPTILSAFVAAQLLYPIVFKKLPLTLLVILLFLPQIASFAMEHNRFPSAPPNLAAISAINSAYPLGTIFYEKHDFARVSDLRQLIHMDDIHFAGRAFISLPPEAYLSYMLHPDVLTKLGIEEAFAPCSSSFYGHNVPGGKYVSIDGDAWIEKNCE